MQYKGDKFLGTFENSDIILNAARGKTRRCIKSWLLQILFQSDTTENRATAITEK